MPTLIHGAPISPSDIETATANWTAERFTNLCNDIVWSETNTLIGAVPILTGRVHVADNGIDAEWIGHAKRGGRRIGKYLRLGTNVFQYKKRSPTADSRSSIASQMRRSLLGAVQKIEHRTGKAVSSYILFTNVDLTGQQQQSLERAIRADAESTRCHVQILGAAQVSAALNNNPHLRTAYFVEGSFRTWEASWKAHCGVMMNGESGIGLVGREEILASVSDWIDDTAVRVVVLTGPHSMGKTRIALEAMRQKHFTVVEYVERRGLDSAKLSVFQPPGGEVILYVDDPELNVARQLAADVLGMNWLTLLITYPTASATPVPNFGLDPRIRRLNLKPLTETASQQLLGQAGAKFDYGVESWLLEKAGGIPGIILAAASVDEKLRDQPENFAERIASAFEEKARDQLSEAEFGALRLASCLSFVGVEDVAVSDTKTLCDVFGEDDNAFLNAITPICEAGFARRLGSFVEVVPPFLANHLSAKLFRGRQESLRQLIVKLTAGALKRFLRRATQMSGPEVEGLWVDFLALDGSFGSMDALLKNTELFHQCAPALPESIASQIAEWLLNSPRDAREAIAGSARRDLVWGLQDLLVRREASEGALVSLGLLAEAENENLGNNASGVFRGAFHPLHPQIPLPLSYRLEILKRMITDEADETRASEGLEAAVEALNPHAATTLHRSRGSSPLDTIPEMTWHDVWVYQTSVLGLIESATTDTRRPVRTKAKRNLPDAAAHLCAKGTAAEAVRVLLATLDHAVAKDYEFNIHEVAGAVNRSKSVLRQRLKDYPELRQQLTQLEAVGPILESAPLPVRIRRAVGGWSSFEDDGDDVSRRFAHVQRELDELANEACSNLDRVDQQTIKWLLSPSAQQSQSFWCNVGTHDVNGSWLTRIEEFAQADQAGDAFRGYLAGWHTRDESQARDWFARVASNEANSPIAIALGAISAEVPDEAANRMCELVRSSRLEPDFVASLMHHWWMTSLSTPVLCEIFRVIAGNDWKNARLIIQPIALYLHGRQNINPELAELTWQCLESSPPCRSDNDHFHCDEIAAKLVPLDPERGFRLLGSSMSWAYELRAWNPITSEHFHKFWDALCSKNRSRVLELALNAVRDSDVALISYRLKPFISLDMDAALLLDFAERGEEEAAIVAEILALRPKGFWQLAFALVERYPLSEDVLHRLSWAGREMGGFISGHMSDHLQRCLAEAGRALDEEEPKASARAWLERLIAAMRQTIDLERNQEANEEANW